MGGWVSGERQLHGVTRVGASERAGVRRVCEGRTASEWTSVTALRSSVAASLQPYRARALGVSMSAHYKFFFVYSNFMIACDKSRIVTHFPDSGPLSFRLGVGASALRPGLT